MSATGASNVSALPRSEPDRKGDLKSLPLAEVEKRLESSPVAPFRTDTDPQDPVYHDRSDCPYGREIMHNGNDEPGTDGRRRCDWCSEHAA